MTLIWKGDQFLDKLKKEFDKKLVKIGRNLVQTARRALSRSGTSSPGRYPAKDSGDLQASVNFKLNKKDKEVIMYSDEKHGVYLEKGTSDMAARPWMTLTNKKTEKKTKQIMKAKLK